MPTYEAQRPQHSGHVLARIVVEVEIDPQEWAQQTDMPNPTPRAVRRDAEVRLTGRILHALAGAGVRAHAAPMGQVPLLQRLAEELTGLPVQALPYGAGHLNPAAAHLVAIVLDGQRITADGAL